MEGEIESPSGRFFLSAEDTFFIETWLKDVLQRNLGVGGGRSSSAWEKEHYKIGATSFVTPKLRLWVFLLPLITKTETLQAFGYIWCKVDAASQE